MMNNQWSHCKRILCIRADNLGDTIMSGPAIRALKESFGAHITLLTSTMAQAIAPYMPAIDEVIVANLPWVKAPGALDGQGLGDLAAQLAQRSFDAVVIFTVYSQSALPAAMLALMAGIPRRLAYCRENPYQLLTDWVPDKEPYRYVVHQVERDLHLVYHIGAMVGNDRLVLHIEPAARLSAINTMQAAGIKCPNRFIIMHPGVSETKREYSLENWQKIIALLQGRRIPMLFTGIASERSLVQSIMEGVKSTQGIYNTAGLLNLGEFISLIDSSAIVLSVNTATIHIAAARQKTVIALYALTNPQHTPWKTSGKVFYFSIKEALKSKNEIVKYVQDHLIAPVAMPGPEEIVATVEEWWNHVG